MAVLAIVLVGASGRRTPNEVMSVGSTQALDCEKQLQELRVQLLVRSCLCDTHARSIHAAYVILSAPIAFHSPISRLISNLSPFSPPFSPLLSSATVAATATHPPPTRRPPAAASFAS